MTSQACPVVRHHSALLRASSPSAKIHADRSRHIRNSHVQQERVQNEPVPPRYLVLRLNRGARRLVKVAKAVRKVVAVESAVASEASAHSRSFAT